MDRQFYKKITKVILFSFFIVSLFGFFFITSRKQDASAVSEIEYVNKPQNIELTITDSTSVAASERTPVSIKITSILANNLSFPISYQTGCGVAPILYARSMQTGRTYKLLVENSAENGDNNSCISQDVIITPNTSQILMSVYHLDEDEMNMEDAGTIYEIEQGISYRIHTREEKERYKETEEGVLLDNFPLKRIRSNKLQFSSNNSEGEAVQGVKTQTKGLLSNTPAPTAIPTSVAVGFFNPSAQSADTGGDRNGFDSNPKRAYTKDSSFAVDKNSGSGTSNNCLGADKDGHRFYNYNIALPAGGTPSGIEVQLVAKVDSTVGTPIMCVQLSWDSGATWTNAQVTSGITKSKTTYTLGGPANVWGRAWKAEDLSNPNFRLRVINVSSNTSRDFSLDWVGVKVYYKFATPTLTPTSIPTNTPTPPIPTPTVLPPTATITPTQGPTITSTPSIPYPYDSRVGPFYPKVLVIDYNTTGTAADGSEALTNQLIAGLKTASRYHNSSISSANFSVFRRFVENKPPPLNASGKADYPAIYAKYDICTIAATHGVNFVWIWASGLTENYAGTFVESVATGPTFNLTYGIDVPTCPGITVTTFGLNYNTSVANAVHSFGHYIENVGYYAFGPVDFDTMGASDMWDLFDGQAPRYRSYTGPVNSSTAHCGNIHFPPNTRTIWDYANTTTVQSNCETYNPGNPSAQVYAPVNASTWTQKYTCDPSIQDNPDACRSQQYFTWWMQNLPGYDNNIKDLSQNPMPNWWQYILSIDSTIRFN